MAVKLGAGNISKLYLGSTEIQKAYLGSTLVYQVAASGFDADYQAVLDYATTQGYTLPSAGQQILQNDLVVALKTAGVWIKRDTIYVPATDGNSDFATINWRNPNAGFNLIKVNSPYFDVNDGFGSDAAAAYLGTNWNMANDASNYTQDDASTVVYVTKCIPLVTATNSRLFGNMNNSNYSSIRFDIDGYSSSNRIWYNSSSFYFYRIYQQNGTVLVLNRDSSTTGYFYTRGYVTDETYQDVLDTTASEPLVSDERTLLNSGGTLIDDPTLRIGFFSDGASLSLVERDDMLTAIRAYMTSL